MASANLSSVLRSFGRSTEAGSDQQLLERFVTSRDGEAFARLAERHGAMVFGVCRRVLRETHDAEDAYQATFLVLARKAGSIRKGESVGSWLHGVALRVAGKLRLEAARRARRERERTAPASAEAGDALSWGELRAVLDEELGRLPARLRTPLILCYLEGQTQDEATRRLGWSKSTFRRRLERGRNLLRCRLARRGVALSAGLIAPLLCDRAALSKTLAAGTVQAALRFGSGPGGGTARPFVLARGVLLGMALARSRWVAVVVLALGLLVGVGWYACRGLYAPAVPSEAQPPGDLKSIAVPAVPVDALGDPLPAEALARLGTMRLRHGASPRALAFAPDGKTVASAGFEGIIHFWDTATGKELFRIVDERADMPKVIGLRLINGLAYAPDGRTLAGARLNDPPCLWDVATGKEIRRFGDERTRALCVVLSADGKMLASAGGKEDPFVRVYDTASGRRLKAFGPFKVYPSGVVFSPDGTTLASADEESILLCELSSERCRTVRQPGEGAVRFDALVFSPDGKTLAAASAAKNIIRLIEPATGKTLRTITLANKREEVDPILFAPDGKSVISGHQDGYVRFWDVATGARQRQFRAHPQWVIALALSSDGRTLATSGNSHVDGEHTVRLWETATGKRLARNPGPEQGIARVVFSPDSQQAATASWEGAIHLWDTNTGKLRRQWNRFGPLAFTPDRKSLLCGGWSDGKVCLLDLASGQAKQLFLAHEKGIRCLALSHDGKTLATAGHDQSLRFWDLSARRRLQEFGGRQDSPVLQLALSPDARTVAAVYMNNGVRLWDTGTGRLLRELRGTGQQGSVAFSPDGTILVTTCAGREPMLRLWDVATGREIRQLRGQGDPLDAVAFSPDGRTLIWGGQHHQELYLWEVATGQLRHQFVGHEGHLSCVAFSPDGRRMASGSSDATVLIWDATGQRQRSQTTTPLTDAELKQLWCDLSRTDAVTAYRAIRTLRASPRQAVALLGQQLKPVPRADAKQAALALANLDSEKFEVRDRAVKELEQLGEAAEPTLRQALTDKPSVEVRRRVEQLLERFEGAELLRRSRALEIVEQIGTPDARRLLAVLANGAPRARLTREAQAALERSKSGS